MNEKRQKINQMIEKVCTIALWRYRLSGTWQPKGFDNFGQGANNG